MSNTSIYAIVLKEVARQGLPFMLLCAGIYFLYTEVKQAQSDVRQAQIEIQDCNNSLIEYYQKDHQQMIKVIDHNNKLLTKIIDK